MYDTPITVLGNVSDAPTERLTPTGRLVANFRVASTPRRYDKATDTYIDSDTLWLGVVCWQNLARHVLTSIKKGQPVIVTGRLVSHEFVKDEQRRVNYEIVADAVGHNLARGTSSFDKAQRVVGVTSVAVGADGTPEDYTEQILAAEFAESEPSASSTGPRAAPLPDSGPLVPLG